MVYQILAIRFALREASPDAAESPKQKRSARFAAAGQSMAEQTQV